MSSSDASSQLLTTLSRIAKELGAHAILLGEFLDHPLPRVRTLCCICDGAAVDNFSYPIAGDPAATVTEAGFLSTKSGVQSSYPDSLLLRDFQAQAYAAQAIHFNHSTQHGIAAVFWRQAAPNIAPARAALEKFARIFDSESNTPQLEVERERAGYAHLVHNVFFQEYALQNPEAFSFSEYMPPVPLDLPAEELLERLMKTAYCVEANRAMARTYGFTDLESMYGATPYQLNGPEKAPRVLRYWVENDYCLRGIESQTVDGNGEITWVLGSVLGKISQGKLVHFWATRSDITAQRRYETAIQHKAHHDALTGLPNRYWFQDRIAALLKDHAARSKKLCVGLLDLNGFKEVNDTLGHLVGDQILQAIAKRLLKGLKPHGAEIARLGGDEFAILIPEVSDISRGEAMANTLQTLLEEPFRIEDMQLPIGGSLGLAMFPEWSETGEDLLRLADIAMYAAKNSGEAYQWYRPEIDKHSKRRLSLLTSLGPAIENGELFLVYQPKIDVWSGRTSGFEALVRWRHPTLGLIPPNDFIPFAETNEVIRPLTRWVLAEAIRQGGEWLRAGRQMKMAVNISVRNLLDEHLESYILECLDQNSYPAELLELEVTESALMTRPAQAMNILQSLRSQGISVAIDDFGTGYSSLAYLARLPVSTLKVDQAFVKEMTRSTTDEQIVRSVIGLAHQCKLLVVAEGVEDEPTLFALLNMGCDLAQGYLIARPMEAVVATAWLNSHDDNATPYSYLAPEDRRRLTLNSTLT